MEFTVECLPITWLYKKGDGENGRIGRLKSDAPLHVVSVIGVTEDLIRLKRIIWCGHLENGCLYFALALSRRTPTLPFKRDIRLPFPRVFPAWILDKEARMRHNLHGRASRHTGSALSAAEPCGQATEL